MKKVGLDLLDEVYNSKNDINVFIETLHFLNIEDLKFLRLQLLTQVRKNNLIIGYSYKKYKCLIEPDYMIVPTIKQLQEQVSPPSILDYINAYIRNFKENKKNISIRISQEYLTKDFDKFVLGCDLRLINPSELCKNAALNGQLEILQLARKNGSERRIKYNFNKRYILEYYEEKCEWDSWTCANAAKNGHLEILKWIRGENRTPEDDDIDICDWYSLTCAYAALNGQLEILQLARKNGSERMIEYNFNKRLIHGYYEEKCEWDSWTCAYAALNGHFNILKWARGEGRDPITDGIGRCQWDFRTCSSAALNGHFNILKWARGVGRDADNDGIGICEWDKEECLQFATSNNFIKMINWINAN